MGCTNSKSIKSASAHQDIPTVQVGSNLILQGKVKNGSPLKKKSVTINENWKSNDLVDDVFSFSKKIPTAGQPLLSQNSSRVSIVKRLDPSLDNIPHSANGREIQIASIEIETDSERLLGCYRVAYSELRRHGVLTSDFLQHVLPNCDSLVPQGIDLWGITSEDVWRSFALADPTQTGYLNFHRFLRLCVLLEVEIVERREAYGLFSKLLSHDSATVQPTTAAAAAAAGGGALPAVVLSSVLQSEQFRDVVRYGMVSEQSIRQCFASCALPSTSGNAAGHGIQPALDFSAFCTFLDALALRYHKSRRGLGDDARRSSDFLGSRLTGSSLM